MNRNCPSCHKVIPDESKFCPECGFNIMLAETSYLPIHRETPPAKPIKKPKILKGFITVIILIGVVICGIFAYNNILWGNDKIAYDLIVEYASSFKDPSSVRLVSGQAGVDESNKGFGFLCLSAKNGFGATTTGFYFLNYLGMSDLEDENEVLKGLGISQNNDYMIELCKKRDKLNIKKVNRALQREWW